MELGGLGAEGVREFLQSPHVVERMLRASEGFPVALEQLDVRVGGMVCHA